MLTLEAELEPSVEVAALPAVLPLADFPSDLTACWLDLPAFFAVWAES